VLFGPDETFAAMSFRNIPRVLAMPAAEAGVADVIWGASLLVSETALEQLTARAARSVRAGSATEEAA
jgi:large subunit ribosomal protein L4